MPEPKIWARSIKEEFERANISKPFVDKLMSSNRVLDRKDWSFVTSDFVGYDAYDRDISVIQVCLIECRDKVH